MYVSDNFVFIGLQKTGSTHIEKLLQQSTSGEQQGKHHRAPPELQATSRRFLASIRNPWDWYVSLWAFGCSGKGRIFRTVTRPRRTRTEQTPDWKSAPLRAARWLAREHKRNPELWQTCYADSSDPALFRRWLKQVLDPQSSHDLDRSDQPLFRIAGLLTGRYLQLLCNGDFRQLATQSEIRSFEQDHCYIDSFIRAESLATDLTQALDDAGVVISPEHQSLIHSGERTNASRRLGSSHYYDDATVQLVSDRERLIVEKFGYPAPTFSPA